MDLRQIPLFSLIREKMSWLSARQTVLSQNIANADTPGFDAQDLTRPDFGRLVARSMAEAAPVSRPGGQALVSNPQHIAFSTATAAGSARGFKEEDAPGWQVSPSGNSVVLEEQMMKVAETVSEYEVATALYSKGIGLIKTAIGKV
ncbi:MAG: flagellar basal-body rod protein FlgB [Alphaproteobacteria bacterium]|nr:flagellar basal-body rod protein FlgB [Alphaproteobacteria bacterium]